MKIRWLSKGAIAALSVCLFAISIFALQSGAQQKKKSGKVQRPPASVEVASIIEKEVVASVELVGNVRAATEATVSAEIDGRIVSFSKREGEPAAKGEAVLRLDESLSAIRAREAKGRLVQAIANLKKAELAARRANELYEKKIASMENKQNADLDVDWAMSAVVLREAELDLADYELDQANIRAPFAGFITKRHTQTGAWVKKGDKVFDIVDTRMVEIITEIPEHLIASASKAKTAQLSFDAYPGKTFEGDIAALVPRANPKTRTFPVRIVMDNPEFLIKAGMFVRIILPTSKKKKAMLIPRDAVVWRFRKAFVFTADEKGKVRSYTVTLGRQYGEKVEAISRELSAGMKLVVTGNEILRDGQTVRVVGEKKL